MRRPHYFYPISFFCATVLPSGVFGLYRGVYTQIKFPKSSARPCQFTERVVMWVTSTWISLFGLHSVLKWYLQIHHWCLHRQSEMPWLVAGERMTSRYYASSNVRLSIDTDLWAAWRGRKFISIGVYTAYSDDSFARLILIFWTSITGSTSDNKKYSSYL